MSHDFAINLNETRKANKEHDCCECSETIQKSEQYVYCKVVGKFAENNPPFSQQIYKLHVSCWHELLAENEVDNV